MFISGDINKAVEILRSGGLVAFPTETVYGLGADATNENALKKIFAVKNRPSNHPLIVHLSDIEQISMWASLPSQAALRLANVFWPGPLTLILKKKEQVSSLITGNQNTIALRIPRHPVALALLEMFNGAIAAPSANLFTRLSPTSAEAVRANLPGVDLILAGDDCEVGIESTILDMSKEDPVILRPGMVTREQLEKELGREVAIAPLKGTIRAPGMCSLHYAPITTTQILNHNEIIQKLQHLSNDYPIAIMAYSELFCMIIKENIKAASLPIKVIQMPKLASEYAKVLYQKFFEIDQAHFKEIWVECLPLTTEWDGINDRIHKAAGIKYDNYTHSTIESVN